MRLYTLYPDEGDNSFSICLNENDSLQISFFVDNEHVERLGLCIPIIIGGVHSGQHLPPELMKALNDLVDSCPNKNLFSDDKYKISLLRNTLGEDISISLILNKPERLKSVYELNVPIDYNPKLLDFCNIFNKYEDGPGNKYCNNKILKESH